MVVLQHFLAVLVCFGLVVPMSALAECECCARGCAAVSVEGTVDNCCEKDASIRSSCDCEAHHSPAAPMQCGSSCECCHALPPVTPVLSTPSNEIELQFDQLATTVTLSPIISGDGIAQSIADSNLQVSPPLRLHALMSVWLN